MQKTASKILFLAKVIEFFENLGYNLNSYIRMDLNARFLIVYKRYIHLDTMHVRNLKFDVYLS